MKKFLLFSCSVLLLAVLTVLLVAGDKTGRIDVQLKGDSFFEGLRIIHKKDGQKQWLLTAQRADISRDGSLATLSGVEMKIEDKGIVIHADEGTYDLVKKKVTIPNTVTASNGDYRITTSDVQIDSSSGSLATDRSVSVEGKRFTLSGTGLRIDQNEQKVRILRDVKATFRQ